MEDVQVPAVGRRRHDEPEAHSGDTGHDVYSNVYGSGGDRAGIGKGERCGGVAQPGKGEGEGAERLRTGRCGGV